MNKISDTQSISELRENIQSMEKKMDQLINENIQRDSLLITKAYIYYRSMDAVYNVLLKRELRKNPELAQQIYTDLNSCRSEIRQKLITTIEDIPEKLRDDNLSRAYSSFLFYQAYEQFNKDLETKPVPDFEFESIRGIRGRLNDFRGKVVLLHFWSMYSSPCHELLPVIKKIQKQYGDRGLEIISINWDKLDSTWKRQVALNFVDKLEMNWICVADGNQKVIHDQFFVRSVPWVLLINRAGFMVKKDLELQGNNLSSEVKKLFP